MQFCLFVCTKDIPLDVNCTVKYATVLQDDIPGECVRMGGGTSIVSLVGMLGLDQKF